MYGIPEGSQIDYDITLTPNVAFLSLKYLELEGIYPQYPISIQRCRILKFNKKTDFINLWGYLRLKITRQFKRHPYRI